MHARGLSFQWLAAWAMIGGVSLGAAESPTPAWHCDAPALSPDGVHVAYLQWDSPFIRVVVVNLDDPGKASYLNIGDRGPAPLTLSWADAGKVELRQDGGTIADLPVDPAPPAHSPAPPRPAVIPPADEAAIRRALPHRSISLLGSDEAGRRILLFADDASVTGRYFVYDLARGLLFEIATRKTPVLPP
jgi:hypothetical protein